MTVRDLLEQMRQADRDGYGDFRVELGPVVDPAERDRRNAACRPLDPRELYFREPRRGRS